VALAIATAEELTSKTSRLARKCRARDSRDTLARAVASVVVDGQEYLFDVAHNPAGLGAALSHFRSVFEGRPLTFVSSHARQSHFGMAEILFPLADSVDCDSGQ